MDFLILKCIQINWHKNKVRKYQKKGKENHGKKNGVNSMKKGSNSNLNNI